MRPQRTPVSPAPAGAPTRAFVPSLLAIYMASTATVAASAVTGHITDPRAVLA